MMKENIFLQFAVLSDLLTILRSNFRGKQGMLTCEWGLNLVGCDLENYEEQLRQYIELPKLALPDEFRDGTKSLRSVANWLAQYLQVEKEQVWVENYIQQKQASFYPASIIAPPNN